MFLLMAHLAFLILVLIRVLVSHFSLSGSFKISPATEPVNTAYIFSRKDLSRLDMVFMLIYLSPNATLLNK